MCRTNLYYGSGCSMDYISKDAIYEAVFAEIRKMTEIFNEPLKSLASRKELSQDMVDRFVEKVIVYDGKYVDVVTYEHSEASRQTDAGRERQL